MSIRQAHSPSSTDGLIGGAFVVVGFVVLIVIATVDLISSRWSPSSPSPSGKEAPLTKDDKTSVAPDIVVKGPIEQQQQQHDSVLDPTVQPHDDQLSYPLIDIPDLGHRDAAKVEDSRAALSLRQEQDSTQAEQHAADDHEMPVPSTTESSQEWVSLSKPDDSQSPNTQPETPPSSHDHDHDHQETPLEFSSSTLIDVPDRLHESVTTIASSSSSPSTPDPDTHHHAPEVHIHSDTEKQLESSTAVEFVPASEILKPRASTPSLYDSHRLTTTTVSGSTSELSTTKKKRGGSFIKKSGTLINKVFKNKEASTSTESTHHHHPHPLASSSADLSESIAPANSAADTSRKKLTSPSRVSLGSIRSIGGSIKKKMGKSPSANDTTASAHEEEEGSPPPLPVNSNEEEVEPSLLKSMFKVRKPSK